MLARTLPFYSSRFFAFVLTLVAVSLLATAFASTTSPEERKSAFPGEGALLARVTGASERGTYTEGYESVEKIGQKVIVARIDGVISRATEELVDMAIDRAERERALVVFEINTPGGLLESAFNIAIRIDSSTVPVVGFVVERWAESAGTLILVTTHIAAMQPGTIIGSMQPIEYDPVSGRYRPVNETKVINPILEFLDERAGAKGRNMTAIRMFVTHNLNLGAEDALRYGVIDYVASNLHDLLNQMHGRVIRLPFTEKQYVLDTKGAYIERFEPTIRIKIVHTLSDPLLSSLLLTLGLAVTLFSIVSGQYPAVPIGVLLLALGLIGSGYSVNITSLFLLVAGAVLLGVELFVTPGFGVLGITGIAMLAVGLALLPVSGGYSFSREYAQSFLYAAYSIGGILGSLVGIAAYKMLKVSRKKPFDWTLEGKIGRAVDDIGEGREGFVVIEGEYWRAISLQPIRAGDTVRVLKKEGPLLVVERVPGSVPEKED